MKNLSESPKGKRPATPPPKHQSPRSSRTPGSNESGPRKQGSPPPSAQIWKQWPSLTITLDRLPSDVTVAMIWTWLSSQGEIVSVYADPARDNTSISARVTFEPPPANEFWKAGKLVVQHPNTSRYPHGLTLSISLQSLAAPWNRVKANQAYPSVMTTALESLSFGSLVNENEMAVAKSLDADYPTKSSLKLTLDVAKRLITIFFLFPIQVGDAEEHRKYKINVPISQTRSVYKVTMPQGQQALIISTTQPPKYFWRRDDILATMSSNAHKWHAGSTWYRATCVAKHFDAVMRHPIEVSNTIASPDFIDIGRWTTLRFLLPKGEAIADAKSHHLETALEDMNVPVVQPRTFLFQDNPQPAMWRHLDHPSHDRQGNALHLLGQASTVIHLSFQVRYQLEVCISRGILNEYSVSLEFLERLGSLEPLKARARLEYFADLGTQICDPMQVFSAPDAEILSTYTRVPHYCFSARKAIVTPTTVRFSSPSVETSNRVIRMYSHLQDRFLKIQFAEETEKGRIAGASTPEHDEIWKRVIRTLHEGIVIGDRHYQFLACGNSQMREHGAYFFCPTSHVSCDNIREWMGVKQIKVIAKHLARLGQCLSSTRMIRGIPVPRIRHIPDIERNGHCFTDGVGIISETLARIITTELNLDVAHQPSAFQFRMGGCKGLLAVWPDATGMEVLIRNSQQKFDAEYNQLEIIRPAKFVSATLNRQTITILESLGVPRQAFLRMLNEHLQSYDTAMTDNSAAIQLLTRFVDENQTTLTIAALLKSKFKTGDREEPFLMNLLHLWRSWSLKLVKEKARIPVEKSAFVPGCVDETGTLRGHMAKTEGSPAKLIQDLPEIFLQFIDPKSRKPRIITGTCIVGRNPALHPGDIRVVQAVNNPRLRHLKDVVVFPSTGDRPLPSMLSGGDLDGDDFFVIWEPDLIPREWNHPPMNYDSPPPLELERDVGVKDLCNFFVKYMMYDNLPFIAHSHLGFADEYGPKSDICTRLASLHSEAVDYSKTGKPAEWDRTQQPRRWPHFMEKRASYTSMKALGVIYDKVAKRNTGFRPEWEHAFDPRVLGRYKPEEGHLRDAQNIKIQYDTAVRRVLLQQDLETEFELWTGFAMSKPAIGSDYKRQEDLGREYGNLKQRFREICFESAGGISADYIDPFVAAMYKVTEEEVQIAISAACSEAGDEKETTRPQRRFNAHDMPLISFPWIFPEVLIRITVSKADCSKGNRMASWSKPAELKALKKEEAGALGNIVISPSNERGATPMEQVAESRDDHDDSHCVAARPNDQAEIQVPVDGYTAGFDDGNAKAADDANISKKQSVREAVKTPPGSVPAGENAMDRLADLMEIAIW